MHQGFGSLLDLGAGVRVPRCIAGGATGIQIKTRKSLVNGPNTTRGDAQVGDSRTHAQWRDERTGSRLAANGHAPGDAPARPGARRL